MNAIDDGWESTFDCDDDTGLVSRIHTPLATFSVKRDDDGLITFIRTPDGSYKVERDESRRLVSLRFMS